jgi:hypothetical protein
VLHRHFGDEHEHQNYKDRERKSGSAVLDPGQHPFDRSGSVSIGVPPMELFRIFFFAHHNTRTAFGVAHEGPTWAQRHDLAG